MRSILIAACLAAGVAVAQDNPFVKGDELKAQVEANCGEGCVTFNREQAAAFEEHLSKLIAAREKAAFQAGVRYQQQACASLI